MLEKKVKMPELDNSAFFTWQNHFLPWVGSGVPAKVKW